MSRAFVGNFTRHVRTLTSHQLPLRTIRHRSYPSADEADIGKINVALNLLYPGIGDKKYESTTLKVLSRFPKQETLETNQTNNQSYTTLSVRGTKKLRTAYEEYQQALFQFGKPPVPDNWIIEQQQRLSDNKIPKVYIPDSTKFFDDFDFLFPIYSNSELVDLSMIFETSGSEKTDIDPTFNDLIELDKLKSFMKFNPMLLAGDDSSLNTVYQMLFNQSYEGNEISQYLNQLRNLGVSSLAYHQLLYESPIEKFAGRAVIRACGFPRIIKHKDRQRLVELMMDTNSLNVLFQYLGVVTLKNGGLSKKSITSLQNYANREQINETGTKNDEIKFNVCASVQKAALAKRAKHTKIADQTLNSIIRSYSQLNQKKPINIEDFKLNERQKILLGYYIRNDYTVGTKFVGINPVFDKDTKIKIVKLFNNSDIKLPIIENKTKPIESPYQLTTPVINNNLINRILLSDTVWSKLGRSIQDNQYVGGMKYSHFINLAILKHLSKQFRSQQDILREILTSDSFKIYLQDYLEIDNFNKFFGCMSETQKLQWTNDLMLKLIKMIKQLDLVSLESFFQEFKLQTLNYSFANTKVSTTKLDQYLQNVSTKETDREFAQELGLKFLKYSCAKEHMDREMDQFIFLNQLISKSVTKSQLIKIGIIVQGNSLEENERFSKILIDSFDITGITKRISKNIPDELTRKFLRRLPRASLNPKPLKNVYESDIDPSMITLPKINFYHSSKRLHLINYYIFLGFMKTIYNKDHFAKLKSLNERISKNAEIGGAYFGYLMLYKLGTCKYIDICTSKVFKRDVCLVTGLEQPFEGQYGEEYQSLMEYRCRNEYLELVTFAQMFNQYVGLLYFNHKEELHMYIEKVVISLKKIE
ncbi:hypothetical protein I503_00629 [Candida albicans SC5314]|uniref:Uncharacterized protein n=1 Tax=Candida albicans P78048 TaxID=1094989 RepID=A0AB34Q2Q1_CANAX|nr:hypothetical protein MG3_00666 [Candida albicans P78048]KGU34004.1 hypothetical protein MG7_00614 [Candida albicans P34048]KHC83409.1 hypothetical protein W5Q_00625 [Candida albicans SC5314]KHC89445.1 hypothetical protein I503_00629 [Candida albicans SC5314]